MVRLSITALVTALLLASFVSDVFFIPNQTNMVSIQVTPIQHVVPAQYQRSEPISITSDSDFQSLGASGEGTLGNPYVFENLFINSTDSCVSITDTTSYFIIRNCKFETAITAIAILFNNVENGRVTGSQISGGATGVNFMDSQNCIVTETTIYGCWNAIYLERASSCYVYDCTIFRNQRGFFFDSTEFCSITNNTIYSNIMWGVEVTEQSYNNTLYGNRFGWNDASGGTESNAIDNGEDNSFDDGIDVGNSWSDHNDSTTYLVPGSSGSIDSFPNLLEDNTPPMIEQHIDAVIDIETSGNTLTWLALDAFPAIYEVRENDGTPTASTWNGGPITIGLDHLPIGTHSIVVVVYDGAGNAASDSIYVTVVSFVLGGIGTELVMFASGITVVSFVIIILLLKKLS